MRREGFQIGRIYGIPILIHSSLIVALVLFASWFYSEFAALHLDLSQARLWGLGLMTTGLFFGSLVVHEVAHSVVATLSKIPVVSISVLALPLFVFGRVRRTACESSRALKEFNIAAAGPLTSLLIADGFYLIAR